MLIPYQKIESAGGVQYYPSEARSSYDENSKLYTLEFNSGVKLRYAEQKPDENTDRSVETFTSKGTIFTFINGINGGQVIGSDTMQDHIVLDNCYNCAVDVSNDYKEDMVGIINKDDKDAYIGNEVKYDASDYVTSSTIDEKNGIEKRAYTNPDTIFGWLKNLFYKTYIFRQDF